jgi:cell division protein ZapA (FtsZ GTPase activity inhibitor)
MASTNGKSGEPRLVSVSLAGSTFTIRTDAHTDYVARLEKYVNDKLEEVQPDGRRLAVRNALALAALSIADDYFSALEKRDALERNVRERLKRVMARVDAALDSDDGPREPGSSTRPPTS